MKITDAPDCTINMVVDGKTVGIFSFDMETGKLTFEGDADESAKIFVQYAAKHFFRYAHE